MKRSTIAVAAIVPWVAVVGMCALQGEASPSLRGQMAKPPVPYEDVGACPFEGCVYRAWTANAPVSVRRDRKASAPVVYAISRGEQVTALTGVVITVKAGRVEFREPRNLSSSDGQIHIVPGETLYLLTYQGEGFTKAWFNGRLYRDVDTVDFFNGVCDFDPARCTGKIVERTESIWWVQVRNRRGQTGWTCDADKFDGKDALGGKAPRPCSSQHPAGEGG